MVVVNKTIKEPYTVDLSRGVDTVLLEMMQLGFPEEQIMKAMNLTKEKYDKELSNVRTTSELYLKMIAKEGFVLNYRNTLRELTEQKIRLIKKVNTFGGFDDPKSMRDHQAFEKLLLSTIEAITNLMERGPAVMAFQAFIQSGLNTPDSPELEKGTMGMLPKKEVNENSNK